MLCSVHCSMAQRPCMQKHTCGALVALRICQHFTSSSPAVKKYMSWMALKPVVIILGSALTASFCSHKGAVSVPHHLSFLTHPPASMAG